MASNNNAMANESRLRPDTFELVLDRVERNIDISVGT